MKRTLIATVSVLGCASANVSCGEKTGNGAPTASADSSDAGANVSSTVGSGTSTTGATTGPPTSTTAGGANSAVMTASSTSTAAGGATSVTTAAQTSASAVTTSSTAASTSAVTSTTGSSGECTPTGADASFSFFVTSYQQLLELAGTPDGFGGDLRYDGAPTGLEGADAICQELARRVCFGHRTWKAYLSTSTVNAIDRIGVGPWHDYAGQLVANDHDGLLVGERPAGGALDRGSYDELGILHDGKTDVDNDGLDDDDHDTMTATLSDGTYAGFSCDDWASTTAIGITVEQPSGGILMGHSWQGLSGNHWSASHAGHNCAPGTNLVQSGGGGTDTVGGGGGYGGFYCFALAE